MMCAAERRFCDKQTTASAFVPFSRLVSQPVYVLELMHSCRSFGHAIVRQKGPFFDAGMPVYLLAATSKHFSLNSQQIFHTNSICVAPRQKSYARMMEMFFNAGKTTFSPPSLFCAPFCLATKVSPHKTRSAHTDKVCRCTCTRSWRAFPLPYSPLGPCTFTSNHFV